ncbi:MAG: SAP domain-containing protein [Gammaproteobacteria bacterium]|nr:SAP domain-containing protein [Gammaproteobacteria bacterium]
MNLQDIRTRARERGIAPGRLTKVGLVRAIQRREGNFDCFATARDGVCDQLGCLWREDCFAAARKDGH